MGTCTYLSRCHHGQEILHVHGGLNINDGNAFAFGVFVDFGLHKRAGSAVNFHAAPMRIQVELALVSKCSTMVNRPPEILETGGNPDQ
jgi:hypothetical protein